MIVDPLALQEIRQLWKGVCGLRGKVGICIKAAATQGGTGAAILRIADIAHNLPFIHAFAVLNEVLLQLRNEGRFNCNSIFLGALLESSKDTLRWVNFNLIEEGVNRRNDVAHHSDIVPRRDCWRYIDAIENELIAWNIIDASE